MALYIRRYVAVSVAEDVEMVVVHSKSREVAEQMYGHYKHSAEGAYLFECVLYQGHLDEGEQVLDWDFTVMSPRDPDELLYGTGLLGDAVEKVRGVLDMWMSNIIAHADLRNRTQYGRDYATDDDFDIHPSHKE